MVYVNEQTLMTWQVIKSNIHNMFKGIINDIQGYVYLMHVYRGQLLGKIFVTLCKISISWFYLLCSK